MNRSVTDVGGEVLAVEIKFTLTAVDPQGQSPEIIRAAGHDVKHNGAVWGRIARSYAPDRKDCGDRSVRRATCRWSWSMTARSR